MIITLSTSTEAYTLTYTPTPVMLTEFVDAP